MNNRNVLRALFIFATVFFLTMMLAACGSNRIYRDGERGETGSPGQDAPACIPLQVSDGVLLNCGANSALIRNGTNGQDAIPVVMIKLCPNVNGSYGGNYPEFAMKVAGKLYAVYSANGKASLAELYPGAYTTTAPGLNCSVIVNANGTIN